MSKNEATGEVAAKKVLKTFTRDGVAILNLRFGAETIGTTSEHPFYVQGKGFVKAGDLGVGTSIVTRAGPSLALHEAATKHTARVYNFEVADFHTYFVGKSALWVHNAGPCLTWGVDPAVKQSDLVERPSLFDGLAYKVNPTAKPLQQWLTQNGNIRSSGFSGNLMYVIDTSGNIIIGKRNPPGWLTSAPHCCHLGGENPQVLAAGMISVLNGKIKRVDRASGHFKPGPESLTVAEEKFRSQFPTLFHSQFEGFVDGF